jgi:arginine decarboxylase
VQVFTISFRPPPNNLFGDTNVVSVRINGDGGFDVMKEISGDSISDVLSYVEYHPQTLFENFRNTAEEAVRSGKISLTERQRLLEEYSASLRGYRSGGHDSRRVADR